MRKSRSGVAMPNSLAKGLSTSKSFVGTIAKSFGAANYTPMEDGLDSPLVSPQSNPSLEPSLSGRSSRYFSEDEVPRLDWNKHLEPCSYWQQLVRQYLTWLRGCPERAAASCNTT